MEFAPAEAESAREFESAVAVATVEAFDSAVEEYPVPAAEVVLAAEELVSVVVPEFV